MQPEYSGTLDEAQWPLEKIKKGSSMGR